MMIGCLCKADCSARDGVSGLSLISQLCHCQPVVLVRLVGNPRRERHAEMVTESVSVALVERAQVAKSSRKIVHPANAYAALAKQFVKLLVPFRREPVGAFLIGFSEKICARSTTAWRDMAKVS